MDLISLWLRGSVANVAEPSYASISNNAGAPAVVAHDDPSVATVNTWTRWVIPLQAFADQSMNLIKEGRKSNAPVTNPAPSIKYSSTRKTEHLYSLTVIIYLTSCLSFSICCDSIIPTPFCRRNQFFYINVFYVHFA